MPWPLAILLILALLVGVACEIARRRSFLRFATRGCAGRVWIRAFPDARKEEVREFLQLLVDAFALRRKHVLKFRPDDAVMDVYRGINPPKWTIADQMEVECFAMMLKKRYGVALESFWRDDITLGEVFGRTRRGDIAELTY
jgi:propanediol dehydratase small subunit